MTPTKHLEIFDEKFVDKFMNLNGNLAYEEMKSSLIIDPFDVKRHLIQTVIDVLEETIANMEKQKGDTLYLSEPIFPRELCGRNVAPIRNIVLQDQIDSLTTALSTWQALLNN